MTAFLPVVSCAGVWAYMKAPRRKRVYKKSMGVPYRGAGAGAELGLLRTQFQLITHAGYIMPILIMCAATMRALQDEEINLWRATGPVAVVTLLFVVFALVAQDGRTGKEWAS